jgi:hypothetical protein
MANIIRGGFRPRYPGSIGPRRYEVDSGYATNLFPGDVVTLVAAGTVQGASAGGADLILGVISHCTYVSTFNRRVYGSYIPASTTYSPSTIGSKNASYAWVWDDPNIEYIASVSSNAATDTEAEVRASVGTNCDIAIGAGSTVYGRSGHTLDGAVNTGTLRFRIVDILRDPVNDISSAAQSNWKAICRINEGFHSFYSLAGI